MDEHKAPEGAAGGTFAPVLNQGCGLLPQALGCGLHCVLLPQPRPEIFRSRRVQRHLRLGRGISRNPNVHLDHVPQPGQRIPVISRVLFDVRKQFSFAGHNRGKTKWQNCSLGKDILEHAVKGKSFVSSTSARGEIRFANPRKETSESACFLKFDASTADARAGHAK